MLIKRIASTVVINAAAAGAGLLGTLLIISHFGLAIFGTYTVALAKLSIIALGMELLPGTFAQFRIQDDPKFARAMPTFYLLFGVLAAAVCAGLILLSGIATASWFMLVYLFSLSIQRCLDSQIVARGEVNISVSISFVTNAVRAALLIVLIAFPVLPVADTLWGSLAAGALITQFYLLARRPEFLALLIGAPPVRSLHYLWKLRREYSGYYVNSVLKRAKDTLFPLVCDMILPNKTQLGKVLVFTRANEAVAGQIRVLELFLIHRGTRANIAARRRWILIGSAMLGHAGVIVMSCILLWKHGLTAGSIVTAAGMGLFMYPYVYELAKRSDAYAALKPGLVTYSLLGYIVALAASLGAASVLGIFVTPVLIGCVVFAQLVSALIYALRLFGTRTGSTLVRRRTRSGRKLDAPRRHR